MYFNKTYLTFLAIAASATLVACGGGGDSSGGYFPLTAVQPSTSPTTALASVDQGTAVPTGSTANPGNQVGGGADGGSMPPVLPPPFNAQSAAGKALQAGSYSVSYGMGTVNGEPDQSIWRTTIDATQNGLRLPQNEVFAGNSRLGGDVLADAKRDLFSPTTSGGRNTATSQVRLDDAAGKLLVGAYTTDGFVATLDWMLGVAEVDLAGTPIQAFLNDNRSLTKPIAGLTVGGAFSADAKGHRYVYTATADRFIFDADSVWITKEADFPGSSICGEPSDAPTRVAARMQVGGTFNIVEIEQGTTCTTSVLAAGTPIGAGTWTRKSGVDFDYIQFDYPASVPYSRFNSTFRQSDYDAGVHPVLAIRPGRWIYSFLVPAGTSFQSRNLALNSVGASNVKAALGL